MDVKATLAPGQKGTKRLVQEYGDQLVCVRYRYDKLRQKRYKTVELIIDEQEWQPGVNFQADKKVLLKIGFGELELRELVKNHGGFWDPAQKGWLLSMHTVLKLGLEKRIDDGLGF